MINFHAQMLVNFFNKTVNFKTKLEDKKCWPNRSRL